MECNCNTIATISIRFWKEDRRYNRGSVPFALSSNSALIFNVNIGILSEIQNDLKKKHTIVMQHETQRLSGPI